MSRRWWCLVLGLVFVDCAHAPPIDSRIFGFEEKELGWARGERGGFEVTLDSTVKVAGTSSVRITSTSSGRYGSFVRRIDAAPLVGKHVRLHAMVKTKDVTGYATVFLRVDGGEATYVMADPPPSVDTPTGWSELVADAFIAPGKELTFGVALGGGSGTAWFDELWLEVIKPAPEVPIRFSGRVVEADGGPVPGASVALLDSEGSVARQARTASDGAFEFPAHVGLWALSANAPSRPELVGTFIEAHRFEENTHSTLVLGTEDGVTVQGSVAGVPEGACASVAAFSKHNGDVWVVPFGPDGGFSTTLPRADQYAVSMLSGGVGRGNARRDGGVANAQLDVVLERPTPPAVVEWISHNASALKTTEPAARIEDLKPLRQTIGEARVVALGEATHGTREFFRLKHRLFRTLVGEGFTVFALEIGQVEARAINDYIQTGKGDARSTLSAAGMWVWETEEVLELIEWMRAWNADAAHAPKLQFVGFDMQSPVESFRAVRRFLEQVAPNERATWLAPVAQLEHEVGQTAFASLPKERRAEVLGAIAELIKRFDASRAAWEAATSASAFNIARHDARLFQQAVEQLASGPRSSAGALARDVVMAENIIWLHDNLPAGARMVVSAHNLHVANANMRMGKFLRARFGAAWLSVGLELGDGTFQALRARTDGARPNIEPITLSTPPAGQVNATLLQGGPEVYLLDLRALPESGVVAEWFGSPQLVREVGYVFRSETALTSPQVLTERYDALLFVAHTTRARQLPIDLSRMP